MVQARPGHGGARVEAAVHPTGPVSVVRQAAVQGLRYLGTNHNQRTKFEEPVKGRNGCVRVSVRRESASWQTGTGYNVLSVHNALLGSRQVEQVLTLGKEPFALCAAMSGLQYHAPARSL
jgi:hypothetical protein